MSEPQESQEGQVETAKTYRERLGHWEKIKVNRWSVWANTLVFEVASYTFSAVSRFVELPPPLFMSTQSWTLKCCQGLPQAYWGHDDIGPTSHQSILVNWTLHSHRLPYINSENTSVAAHSSPKSLLLIISFWMQRSIIGPQRIYLKRVSEM